MQTNLFSFYVGADQNHLATAGGETGTGKTGTEVHPNLQIVAHQGLAVTVMTKRQLRKSKTNLQKMEKKKTVLNLGKYLVNKIETIRYWKLSSEKYFASDNRNLKMPY